VSDVLIGAPTYDADIRTDAGRVVETSQVFASGEYNADAVGTTIQGIDWTGNAAGDQLGYAVAGARDVTGDGYDDVVFGAPFVDPIVGGNPQTDAGAVTRSTVPRRPDPGTRSIADVERWWPRAADRTQPGEHAGSSIAGTGDIDGNGDGDFVVGAPDKDVAADPARARSTSDEHRAP
jgi:glycosylphosphatidylinositol phospholipase D